MGCKGSKEAIPKSKTVKRTDIREVKTETEAASVPGDNKVNTG